MKESKKEEKKDSKSVNVDFKKTTEVNFWLSFFRRKIMLIKKSARSINFMLIDFKMKVKIFREKPLRKSNERSAQLLDQ